MLKRNKRNVLLLTLSLLLLAVLIGSLFPKTTVASMLQLDKKEQIVKIELGSKIDLLPPGESHEWKDITGTPLGDRYLDELFTKPTAEDNTIRDAMGLEIPGDIAAIRITLGNLPEDYPFKDREHRILIGLPTNTSLIRLHYTEEAQIRGQEKLNAEGKGEIFDSAPYYEFTLPKNELFTPEFIGSQFK